MTKKKHFGISETHLIPTASLRIATAPTGRPVVVGVEVVVSDTIIAVLTRDEVYKCIRGIAEVEEPEGLKEINDWNYLQIGN